MTGQSLSALFGELCSAVRMLRRHRAFSFTVMATIAIGMGATIALMTAARSILFQPLPYPEGDRLVHIQLFWADGSGTLSYPDYLALLERSRTLESVAAYQHGGSVALSRPGGPISLVPAFITPSYFGLLGARLTQGRALVEDDNRPSGSAVAVLSNSLWRREFGADPSVVGSAIRLNGDAYQVVGVLDASFRDLGLVDGFRAEVFLPAAAAPALLGQPPLTQVSNVFWGLGRRRSGTTFVQVRDDIGRIGAELRIERPDTHRDSGLRADPLRSRVQGALEVPSMLLLGGSILLLLIATGNIANLLLVRTFERRAELSVRLALGALPGHLIRQVFFEAAALTFAGGAFGLALALTLIRLTGDWAVDHVAPFLDLAFDPRLACSVFVLIALTSLAIGLQPALHAGRMGVGATQGSSGNRLTSGGRFGFRSALVAGQVALALVVLVTAGLSVQSFTRLTKAALGFRTERLLTFRVDLPGDRYQSLEARARLADDFMERARAIPGVESATIWGPSMLGNATWVARVAPEGRSVDGPDAFTMVFRHNTNPGGLSDLGIDMLAGRDFSRMDTNGQPIVAIVSESVAREMWPGPIDRALGKRLLRSQPGPPIEVIGVARDARHRERYSLLDIAEAGVIGGLGPQRDIYFAHAQRSTNIVSFAIRIRDVRALPAAALREALTSLDPLLPMSDVRFLDERVAAQELAPRAIALLLSAYAVAAVLLAALGVYTVVSQVGLQRSRDIALRVALGAESRHVILEVLGPNLRSVLLGGAIGLAGSIFAGRAMEAILFDVDGFHVPTFLAALTLLLAAAAGASIGPVRRGLGAEPATALRTD